MKFDRNGIILADVPGSGVSRVDPNARSGNPRHDTRSGKFGAGGGGGQRPTPPPNTDPHEYGRMLDAVREAARQIDDPNDKNITEFIQGRAKSPDQVDVAQFLAAVRQQRLSDLVDMLSQQLSGTKHKVRLTASKVYMRKIMRALTADDIAAVAHRLEAMGHEAKKVQEIFKDRTPAPVTASDDDPIGMAPLGYLELSDSADDEPLDQPIIVNVFSENVDPEAVAQAVRHKVGQIFS